MLDNSTPVLFSIIALVVSGFIGPAVIVLFTYKMNQRARDMVEERAREDDERRKELAAKEERHRKEVAAEVAAEAQKMAREMVRQNERLTRETREEIDRLTERTVDSISSMKNGNLLEAEKRELEANRLALRYMRDAVRMKESVGASVLPETYIAMDRLEIQIRALSAEINVKEQRIALDGDEHH